MRVARSVILVALAAWVLLGGATPGVAPSVPSARAQEIVVGQPAFVNVDSLTVRAAPGLDATVVVWLDYGTPVSVIDGPVQASGYDWFLLAQDGDELGWSVQGIGQDPASFIFPEPPTVPTAETIWVVTEPFITVRAQASATSPIARTVTIGTELTQDAGADGGVEVDGAMWFPVDGGGWIGGPAGGPSAGVSLDRYPLYVSADALNVRADPSLSGEVVQVLEYGDAVNVFNSTRDADGNDWNAVNEDGTLWVSSDWVTVSLAGAAAVNAMIPAGHDAPLG